MTPQELIDNHSNLIHLIISKQLRRIQWMDVSLDKDDLTQAAFLQCIENIHLWNPAKGSLGTYLEYVVRTGVRRELERATWAKHRRPDAIRNDRKIVVSETYEFPVVDSYFKQEQPTQELPEKWITVLNGLKPKEKRALELLASGLTYAEVGKELGLTRQRIYQLVDKVTPKLGMAA